MCVVSRVGDSMCGKRGRAGAVMLIPGDFDIVGRSREHVHIPVTVQIGGIDVAGTEGRVAPVYDSSFRAEQGIRPEGAIYRSPVRSAGLSGATSHNIPSPERA